jgi:hypothetical protein
VEVQRDTSLHAKLFRVVDGARSMMLSRQGALTAACLDDALDFRTWRVIANPEVYSHSELPQFQPILTRNFGLLSFTTTIFRCLEWIKDRIFLSIGMPSVMLVFRVAGIWFFLGAPDARPLASGLLQLISSLCNSGRRCFDGPRYAPISRRRWKLLCVPKLH